MELTEQARTHGIVDLSELVHKALDGNRDALIKLLNLSPKVEGVAGEVYTELAYGIYGAFDVDSLRRFLFKNLEEKEAKAFLNLVKWVETDLYPAEKPTDPQ